MQHGSFSWKKYSFVGSFSFIVHWELNSAEVLYILCADGENDTENECHSGFEGLSQRRVEKLRKLKIKLDSRRNSEDLPQSVMISQTKVRFG